MLKSFLSNPHRPSGTLRFRELQGFLFTIASSPETIRPSEWLPIISNDEDMGFENEIEAQRVLNLIMALYNQVNSSVLERSDAMPPGCEFQLDIDANFDEVALSANADSFEIVEAELLAGVTYYVSALVVSAPADTRFILSIDVN